MARKYGGYTSASPSSVPSNSDAPGAWVSTEQYRQQGAVDVWPPDAIGAKQATVIAGSYILAVSSGAYLTASGTDGIVPTLGQTYTTASLPELNDVIGQTFGGDGSTNFSMPSGAGQYVYFKTATTAVSGAANFRGSQTIPDHTHTYTQGIFNAGEQGPGGGFKAVANVPVTQSVGNTGSTVNRLRNRQVYPLLVTKNNVVFPKGCVFPVLIPADENSIGSIVNLDFNSSDYFFVCSGQAVSRTANPTTFNLLGTTYGSGDGSTTFNIPDFRGCFLENARFPQLTQVPVGLSYTASSFASHFHLAFTYTAQGAPGGGGGSVALGLGAPATGSTAVGDGTEDRPNNVSVVWLIPGG